MRRLVLAGCLTFAGAGAAWARRGGGRAPSHRPPTMPNYRGQRLRVPHLSPGVGFPRQRLAQPIPAPHPWAPGAAAGRPAPVPESGAAHGKASLEFVRPAAPAVQHPPRAARPAFGEPKTDERGRPMRARAVLDVTRTAPMVHETVGAAPFAKSVAGISSNAAERDGQFHWHNVNGVWTSHWYDRAHGQDWIGVYQGGQHFWTIYWHDHFWWQEPGQRRWLSFWRDHWWWHSPDGGYFVFIDGQYYAWNPGVNGVTLVAAAPAPAQAVSGNETLVVSSRPEFTYSADGTRMVQIEGDELSAYLWDLTRQDAQGGDVMLKFLGQNVTGVAFSDASKGPLRITLSIQDNGGGIHQQVLDAQGNPVTDAPQAQPPAPPAAPAFGTPGNPGFDSPGGDLPPIDAPQPDGN